MRHANWGFVTRKSPRSSSIRAMAAERGEGFAVLEVFRRSLSRECIFHIPLVDNGLNGERNEVSRFRIRSFAPRVSGLIA